MMQNATCVDSLKSDGASLAFHYRGQAVNAYPDISTTDTIIMFDVHCGRTVTALSTCAGISLAVNSIGTERKLGAAVWTMSRVRNMASRASTRRNRRIRWTPRRVVGVTLWMRYVFKNKGENVVTNPKVVIHHRAWQTISPAASGVGRTANASEAVANRNAPAIAVIRNRGELAFIIVQVLKRHTTCAQMDRNRIVMAWSAARSGSSPGAGGSRSVRPGRHRRRRSLGTRHGCHEPRPGRTRWLWIPPRVVCH